MENYPACKELKIEKFLTKINKQYLCNGKKSIIIKNVPHQLNLPVHPCTTIYVHIYYKYHTGLNATKPVFGVSDKARLKPISPATETS